MTRAQIEQKTSIAIPRIGSGSTLLDLALGGGWALGRVSNVVGDKSTGKTLQAIEALANFVRQYPGGLMRYAESEAAFDESFAATMGFPNGVSRPTDPLETVEQFYYDLDEFIKDTAKRKVPGIYVLDSLDALSDAVEMAEEDIEKGTYGMSKPKQMGKLFRKRVRAIEESQVHLMVISQVRDNIGVTFGESHTRSGGKALDFYASQIVWLAQTGQIKRQALNDERVTGVYIKANVKKCKVGYPFRKVDYPIIFGYGVDDEVAMIEWLKSLKVLKTKADGEADEATQLNNALKKARSNQDWAAIKLIHSNLVERVNAVWWDIEDALKPPMQKYAPMGS